MTLLNFEEVLIPYRDRSPTTILSVVFFFFGGMKHLTECAVQFVQGKP